MSSTPSRTALRTLLVVSAALFMTALDNLIVTVALPSIRADLGASIEDLEWTVNAYTLTFAVLLIPAAALGDRFRAQARVRRRPGPVHAGLGGGRARAVDRRARPGARASGRGWSGHRPALADAAGPRLPGGPPRAGARRLVRRQRLRRRHRATAGRPGRRGARLAVDLLDQRPTRRGAAAARAAPPAREPRPC